MRTKLLAWYDREGRDLPWRRSRDPYAIWVSEVMLQQTRVETVIPYYQRFLARFPTPRDLAAADEDTVLAHWSGLGYYRRARLLHEGVREVVAEYGGKVPEEVEARRSLPGIGRYTAGAIGSIAFDKQEPVVDGNVSRVLARLFRIETPLGSTAMTKRLWHEAGRLVAGERPGDFNQALMELGATVCVPRNPRCGQCPLQSDCQAHEKGDALRLPVRAPRKAPVTVTLCAVVATSGRGADRCVWLTKGNEALFGGLWGLPTDVADPRVALAEAGVRARLQPDPVTRVEHVLTHRRLVVDVYRATAARAVGSSSQPFTANTLGTVGVSALTHKALERASFGFLQT